MRVTLFSSLTMINSQKRNGKPKQGGAPTPDRNEVQRRRTEATALESSELNLVKKQGKAVGGGGNNDDDKRGKASRLGFVRTASQSGFVI